MLQGENADTASMKLGNTFYDGQAKAGTLRFPAGILAAVIAVKEMCRILRRDSPSVVGTAIWSTESVTAASIVTSVFSFPWTKALMIRLRKALVKRVGSIRKQDGRIVT